MISMAKPLVCAAFLGFSFSIAQAQLAWDKTEIELNPKPGEQETVAKFKYQNKGQTPVRIVNVRSSCGCTVAAWEKDPIAPGAKGDITATFTIGNRTGAQQKGIRVETDHAAEPITNLLLKANIPQVVDIQPTFIYWEGGEAPKPKTITLRAGKDIAI